MNGPVSFLTKQIELRLVLPIHKPLSGKFCVKAQSSRIMNPLLVDIELCEAPSVEDLVLCNRPISW